MATHEGDDFEEGWFLNDHSHTHQRELYEMDDDVDDEHGIIIDQPGDDELDQPPPKDMMTEAVHDTSSLWQPIPPSSTGADKSSGAVADDWISRLCSKADQQDGGQRRVKDKDMQKLGRTSSALSLLATGSAADRTSLCLQTDAQGSSESTPEDFLARPRKLAPMAACAPPMAPKLSQAMIMRAQKTAKISDVIENEMAACCTFSTERANHKLSLAGLRRHLKQEQGTNLVSSETPVVLAKICELFLSECCEAAVQHSSSNTLQPTDFARAFRHNTQFRFLTQQEDLNTKSQ